MLLLIYNNLPDFSSNLNEFSKFLSTLESLYAGKESPETLLSSSLNIGSVTAKIPSLWCQKYNYHHKTPFNNINCFNFFVLAHQPFHVSYSGKIKLTCVLNDIHHVFDYNTPNNNNNLNAEEKWGTGVWAVRIICIAICNIIPAIEWEFDKLWGQYIHLFFYSSYINFLNILLWYN